MISVSTIATPTSGGTISPTSSFEDLDNDLTLSNDEDDEDEDDDEEADDDDDDTVVRPSRTRGRVSLGRPGNTFTPVIRPVIGRDRNKNCIFRPSKLRVSTMVATRTQTSVKPNLIATPTSSAPQPTPSFGSILKKDIHGFQVRFSIFRLNVILQTI